MTTITDKQVAAAINAQAKIAECWPEKAMRAALEAAERVRAEEADPALAAMGSARPIAAWLDRVEQPSEAPIEGEPVALLNYCGADAMRWAKQFNATAYKLGYPAMDEGWLVGWFANAIEHSAAARHWAAEKAKDEIPEARLPLEPSEEAQNSANLAFLGRHPNKSTVLDALRAAYAIDSKTDEWMPIESAPKDGTEILAFGLWAGEIHGPAKTPMLAIVNWSGRGDFPGFDWGVSGGDAYASWMKPTHWRHLPAPPKGQAND